MKYFKIITILLFSSVISFYGCNDSTNAKKQDTNESVKVLDSPTTPNAATPNAATPNPATTEPAQNTNGVFHYTCNKGCAGGAGAAGPCGTCGNALAHNSAYHAKTNNTPTSSSPFATPPPTPAPKAEPSQNTAGVWHYTCGKGCAGGGGSAGSCGTCGGALAHNSAYHQ